MKRRSAAALVFGTRLWTWAELDAEVVAWTARLAALGVGPRDRVALLSHNRPEFVFAFHAALRLGAALVPLNARLAAPELATLVQRAVPRCLLAEAALAHLVPGAEVLERVARHRPGRPPRPALSSSTAAAALLFTSGTTGAPKLAVLTRGNFEANARSSADNLGGGCEQRWLACLPLFHVGGLAMISRCAAYGACLVVQERFDPDEILRAFREGVTHTSLVENGLRRLLAERIRSGARNLRAILVGGGPVTPALLERARSRGLPVLQTYGLTEACSQVATERTEAADGRTAGPPLPGLAVRLLDQSGAPVPAGDAGEIAVRGATVMRGYFRDAAATRSVLADGWLRTGDVGRLDRRGRLEVHARRQDLIVSGGENIYPAQVEAALQEHPGVAEVAVTSLPDETWGCVPAALWVARRRTPTPAQLARWCRKRLAGFEVPRLLVRVPALPRTALGKLDRSQLPALLSVRRPQEPTRE